VVLHGFEGFGQVTVNTTGVPVQAGMNRFFSSLEKFDPIHDPAPAPEEPVQRVHLAYSNDAIEIRW
jgi:hypothetical protein